MATSTQDALARIDVARARRIGQMLAPSDSPDHDKDPGQDLVDLGKLDGKGLLARYRDKMARYATSPFDPNGAYIRFYPGGVTIWSGFPGIGKTTMLRQMICYLLQRDQSVFTASLEEHPEDQLARMIETAAGTGERASVGPGMDPSDADILPDHIEGEEDEESSSEVDSDFDTAVAEVHDLAADESDEEDEDKDG